MPFNDLTIEQLRAATKQQLITTISDHLAQLTKKQIIVFILKLTGLDLENLTITEIAASEDGPEGQKSRLILTKDVLGKLIKSTLVEWSYYKSGPVNNIIITEHDENQIQLSKHTIKHYLDGRQPHLVD